MDEVIVKVKFKVKDANFKANSNLLEALKTIISKTNIPNSAGYSIFINGKSYLREKDKKLKNGDNITFIPIIFGG